MSKAKFFGDAHPPGLHFDPTDEELVKLYLLPRVRGEADPFPGLIIDDDKAGNTQPWILFPDHGLPVKEKDPAFFYVRNNDARPGARPSRVCEGGGTWKSQKSLGKNKDDGHVLLVDDEKIRWSRHNLNLDMGSGSMGWVMHEYIITDHPSLKICRISFSGHGHKRMLVPDGYDDASSRAGEPATKRARVAAADKSSACASWTTTTSFHQDFGAPAHVSGDQGFGTAHDSGDSSASASWTITTCSDQDEHSGTAQASYDQEPEIAEMTYADGQLDLAPPMMEQRVDQGPSAAQVSDDEELAALIAGFTADTQPPQPYYMVGEEQVPAAAAAQMSDDEETAAMIAEMADSSMVPVLADQEPVAAQMSEEEEAAAMVAEMTDASMVPVVADQEPGCTFDVRSYTHLLLQNSCRVPTNVTGSGVATGTLGAFALEGIDFCY